MNKQKPITAIMLGAGNRGLHAYGPYGIENSGEIQFVAVAEPDPERRYLFAQAHDIPADMQFESWEDLLSRGQLADTAFNMTQDGMHYVSTVAMLNAGYDCLLEKPMTNRLDETIHLVQLAEQKGQLLQICHVLRYTPFFSKLNEIVVSGRLGEIINVAHRENVVYWHMAHSYVRGNWRNLERSSPMILAKCCHDLDILYWNMGKPADQLQSFGSLLHFQAQHKPSNAAERCLSRDGTVCSAADNCQFDAHKIYLDPGNHGWPINTITTNTAMEARLEAIKHGPYGRCVYACDNDVVDNQTVNMQFPNGATVTMTMHGHSHRESRTMRYDGTRATLRGLFEYGQGRIEIHDHLTSKVDLIEIEPGRGGHGGGDFKIVKSFVDAVRGEAPPLTTARESLESHLMAFAAEESRLTSTVIKMDDYRKKHAV
ncbi:MAG: Gfo/Idh/MocA family oxidoreductase [Chloroflexota bacterium]